MQSRANLFRLFETGEKPNFGDAARSISDMAGVSCNPGVLPIMSFDEFTEDEPEPFIDPWSSLHPLQATSRWLRQHVHSACRFTAPSLQQHRLFFASASAEESTGQRLYDLFLRTRNALLEMGMPDVDSRNILNCITILFPDYPKSVFDPKEELYGALVDLDKEYMPFMTGAFAPSSILTRRMRDEHASTPPLVVFRHQVHHYAHRNSPHDF